MRVVAEGQNIPLFGRFAIMKHLVKSGQYTTDQLLAPDNFHLNDLSYGCLADLLADAIEEQVKSAMRTAGPPALLR
jgi:lysophospholipase L1-like esterase